MVCQPAGQLVTRVTIRNPWPRPELPDITIYIDALETRIQGTALTGLRLKSPYFAPDS